MYKFLSTMLIITMILGFSIFKLNAQETFFFESPDTGQTGDFTQTVGEDSDFSIHSLSYTDNTDGTITDNVTGLMWQKTDGGEMSFDSAIPYCQKLTLGGFNDWRLPSAQELFSIISDDDSNPAIDSTFFTKTRAEYWWSSEVQVGDSKKVWVVNAGGGIGPHPISETISAGGTKFFHVRAVRNSTPVTVNPFNDSFTDNGDGSITDHRTGLIWQKIPSPIPMTWEEALLYSQNLDINFDFGIVSYNEKTRKKKRFAGKRRTLKQ